MRTALVSLLVRHFLAGVLAFGFSRPPATASPMQDRDAARAASEDEQASATPGRSAAEKDEPGHLYSALGWAAFGVSAGDFASTEWVLAEGGRELNPFMQARGVRIGASVAYAPVVNYLTEELRKDGHPRLALWMRIAVVAVKGWAIADNLRRAGSQ